MPNFRKGPMLRKSFAVLLQRPFSGALNRGIFARQDKPL
jgi:hypothetical protein